MNSNKILLNLFILTATSLFFFTSCQNSPAEPEEIQGGRRDYVWTIDTMPPTPYNGISRVWGSSERNLWGVAYGGVANKEVWHFNGSAWITLPWIPDFTPNCIYGFDETNIWAGSVNGEIWKGNGYTFKKFSKQVISGFPHISYENMWGESPDDVYAVGTAFSIDDSKKGFIMHFDGTKWEILQVTEDNHIIFIDARKDSKGSNLLFIGGLSHYGYTVDSSRVWTFDGNQLKQIYVGEYSPTQKSGVYRIDGRVYITIGQKIFKYENNSLQLWKDFTGTNFQARMWGRNENDFFYISTDGGIGHYNGKDLVTIYNNFFAYNAVILNDFVFFHTFDEVKGSNIFLKGKLKTIKE